MKKLNKININELLNNYDDEKWYNLLEEDKLKFNKSGYYKIKCKDDSIQKVQNILEKNLNVNMKMYIVKYLDLKMDLNI